jgi:hypothetical protein
MPQLTAARFHPLRRQYSEAIQGAAPRQVLALANGLIELGFSQTHMAYALVGSHRPTRDSLTERTLKRLGRALGDWSTADAFSLFLGGTGDVPRTLAVCRQLVTDRDDMVVKGVSWALREIVTHDRGAVRRFLAAHDSELAGRVKREVTSKLTTGRKSSGR